MNYFRDLTDDECKIYDSWINQESIKTVENLFNDSKPKTNKAKILRLLDEADDIVRTLYRQGANKDYQCKLLREKLKEITTEIS